MLKQIFRKIVPPNMLFEILEKVCLKTDKYYVIDLNAYKKLIFHNLHIKMYPQKCNKKNRNNNVVQFHN